MDHRSRFDFFCEIDLQKFPYNTRENTEMSGESCFKKSDHRDDNHFDDGVILNWRKRLVVN